MVKQKRALAPDDLEGGRLDEFDPAAFLTSDEAIAAYITDIVAADDMALLNSAIDDVARACGAGPIRKFKRANQTG